MKTLTFILFAASISNFVGCAVSTHATVSAEIGIPTNLTEIRQSLSERGPIEFERIVAADWAVDRSGLINFENEKAQHLDDELERVEIYVYRITHPQYGTWLIDTGISEDLADDGKSEEVKGMIAGAMNADKLRTHVSTTDLLKTIPTLEGIFLTHLHLDHIFGMPDIDDSVPIYTGPGEAQDTSFKNMFVKGTMDRLLDGKSAIREWSLDDEHDAIDVFGDKSFWVIHTPGHTPGSVAFLMRTANGPVLVTGDTCHTGFGWENEVEPGSYTGDHEANRDSLQKLISLSKAFPEIEVHLGHQRVGQKLIAY